MRGHRALRAGLVGAALVPGLTFVLLFRRPHELFLTISTLSYLAILGFTIHQAGPRTLANPVHSGLLHRQVDGPYRNSVISLNSMVAQPGFALGAVGLTALADATSVSTAMLVGAAVLAVAAPLYLPARRPAPAPTVLVAEQ